MLRGVSVSLVLAAAIAGATLPNSGCWTCEEGTSVTFEREESGTDATLRDAVSLGDDSVAAVGDGGAIVLRDAKGDWSLRTGGTTNNLYAVAARTVGTQTFATAVGEAGAIVSSADGGLTWKTADSGTTADLRAVAHGTAVIAVGDGVILRRSGSQGPWEQVQPVGGVGSLRAVASLEVPGQLTRFVAVGDGGAVFFSADNGEEWIRRDGGTLVDLRAAGVYHGGDGLGTTPLFWIAGVDGTVRAARDGSLERWKAVDIILDDDIVILAGEADWLLASDGSLHLVDGTPGPSTPWGPPDEQVAPQALLGLGAALDDVWLLGDAGTIVRARSRISSCIR